MTACAPHGARTIPLGDGPLVGTYKAAFTEDTGRTRRARLLLWIERPDRLHAELLAPVGGSRLTLDAGGGRACLVDASEGIAYVGAAGHGAIEALTGLRVTIAEVIAAALDGASADGIDVQRSPDPPGSLPSRLRLTTGGTALALEWVAWERIGNPAENLGTGAPPAGLTVRPLDAWRSGARTEQAPP